MQTLKRISMICLVLALLATSMLSFNLQASAIAGGGAAQSSYRAYGADLSFWNVSSGGTNNYSLVDFARMKADGCQFVILRIGFEGSSSRTNTLDTAFVEYYNRARAAGMPLGVYFYSLATTYNGAVEDANWVADKIEQYGMYFEYPIYYDVEDSTYTGQTSLGSSAMNSLCLGWCETLEARGYFPGVYGGKSQVLDKLTADFKSKYDTWYPRVAVNGHGTQYNPNNYDYSAQYSMWQYAWYDYEYDGIGMDMLDVNVCYKDYPSIMTKYGYNNCKPAESEAKTNLRNLVNSVSYSTNPLEYSEATLEAIRAAAYQGTLTLNNDSATDTDFINAYNNIQALLAKKANVLSAGKSYTATAPVRSDDFADDGVCLTNGLKGNSNGGDSDYAGWQNKVEIVVDLGSAQTSDTYTAYIAAGSWGIHLPKKNYYNVEVLTSNSAASGFTSVGSTNNLVHVGGSKVEDDGWTTYTATIKASSAISARYVKFVITNNECTGHIWLDEVEVSLGDPAVVNGAYISAINSRINSGNCNIFNSSFGTISVSSANHAWTYNVIAEYDSAYNAYIVKSVSYGSGSETADITLSDGQILIAAHDWETGVTDGTQVVGSAANYATVKSAQVGDMVYLSGLDVMNGFVTAGAFVSFKGVGYVADDAPAVHYPGEDATCSNPQTCTACGTVITPATGHTEGEWETLSDGTQVLKCTKCGEVLDTKGAEDEEPSIVGDVNLDGKVNMFDYLIIKSIYFNKYTPTEGEFNRSDVNNDGKVNMFDYIIVKGMCFE